eukprot:m.308432 g.308432  ORF g.308432 m.308432 type:complete len:85 (+) comp23027_c0_seq4:441-695(+)
MHAAAARQGLLCDVTEAGLMEVYHPFFNVSRALHLLRMHRTDLAECHFVGALSDLRVEMPDWMEQHCELVLPAEALFEGDFQNL